MLLKILGSLYLIKDLIVGGNSSRFGDFIVSELRKLADLQSERKEPTFFTSPQILLSGKTKLKTVALHIYYNIGIKRKGLISALGEEQQR